MSRARSFWEELRRRHVVRVGTAYVVGAVAVGGAAEIFLPGLGAPEWVLRTVLGLLVLGLPLAIGMAWAYDITPEGIQRASPNDRGATGPGFAPTGDRTSIVVLPFDNMSPDPNDAYFCDGLTEEIITDLSRIRALGVISRTSAMRLRGTDKDVRTIGRELGVRYVLEGSVRKRGQDLRITAQLIDAASDQHIWAEKYTGTVEEVFEIQERVAEAIARALRIELTPVESKEIAHRRISDPLAYESYLRARHELLRFSGEGLEAAQRHIRNGLNIVGENEMLLATLGQVHLQYFHSGIDPDPAHLERAEEAADRIFSAFPDSYHGHRLKGLIAFQQGQMEEARPRLETALDRDPDDPDALLMLGYLQALSGREDLATTLFQRVIEIDPLTPVNHAMPGFVALLEGRHEDAVKAYRTFLEMDGHGPFSLACWVLALCHLDDRLEEAAATSQELAKRYPETAFASMATSLVLARQDEGAAALQAISPALLAAGRDTEMFSRFLTGCYALAGDTDPALKWLVNTVRLGNVNYPYLSRISPFLENLRSEVRFQEIMERVERAWRAFGTRQ